MSTGSRLYVGSTLLPKVILSDIIRILSLESLEYQGLFINLRRQNPPRFPLEQRTRAGLLLFMSTIRLYTKLALSISDQIELLKNRGLSIADTSKAEKFLGEVSYFRFVQYLRPMEADKTTHQFKPNSRFEDAVALYNFDLELRDLMFKAIQRLEIALRTKIIQEFSLAYGPFWFFNINLADDEHKFIENMNSIDKELQRSREDFIQEHRRNYDKPLFPPAWKTLELASLGSLSKLYYNFSDKKLKKRVARQFNIPQHEVLESWMRSITALRNCCAHHSRLWNRHLANAPQMNASLRGAWINIEGIDANKVYAIACCIAYWIDSMGYGTDFKNNLKSLLSFYPQVDPKAMGFPDNWDSEPLWI